MPNPHNEDRTYTRKLSRDIDAAYEAYKAGAPGAEERLLRAFVEQARNIARFRLGEMYDGTVAYDAAHKARLALEDFNGKSRLSTWFNRIAQNESFTELGRLIKKRETESSIDTPVADGEPDETQEREIRSYFVDHEPSTETKTPSFAPDHEPSTELAKLRVGLAPEQVQMLDLMATGLSLEKIAKKLRLPIGTIRSRYRLAKEHIKKRKIHSSE